MRISDWSSDVCSSELSIRSSGESFYQGRIDDPSMSRPMDIALFAKEEGGYDIAWTRRRARQDAPDSGEPAVPPMDDAAPEAPSGGLGASKIGRASWRERVCQYV